MRKFVFILQFCLLFVSSFAEQAKAFVTKTSALVSAERSAPAILSGRLQIESGAEITSTAYTIVSASVKRAEQTRDNLYIDEDASFTGHLACILTSGIIKRSTERLPLHLRLLFPQHFFW